jgi:cell division protein FtsB
MIAKNRKIKRPGKFKDIFFSSLLALFLLLIAGFLVFSNLKINQKRAELTSKIEELRKEVELLEERNEQLKSGIFQTESDDYWEAKLYEQGYKKPGEEAIVVLPPEEESPSEETAEEKKWWNPFTW